jgi:hypothetical protein
VTSGGVVVGAAEDVDAHGLGYVQPKGVVGSAYAHTVEVIELGRPGGGADEVGCLGIGGEHAIAKKAAEGPELGVVVLGFKEAGGFGGNRR